MAIGQNGVLPKRSRRRAGVVAKRSITASLLVYRCDGLGAEWEFKIFVRLLCFLWPWEFVRVLRKVSQLLPLWLESWLAAEAKKIHLEKHKELQSEDGQQGQRLATCGATIDTRPWHYCHWIWQQITVNIHCVLHALPLRVISSSDLHKSRNKTRQRSSFLPNWTKSQFNIFHNVIDGPVISNKNCSSLQQRRL